MCHEETYLCTVVCSRKIIRKTCLCVVVCPRRVTKRRDGLLRCVSEVTKTYVCVVMRSGSHQENILVFQACLKETCACGFVCSRRTMKRHGCVLLCVPDVA